MIKITIESTEVRDKFRYYLELPAQELVKRHGVRKAVLNKVMPFLYKTFRSIKERLC